MRSSFSLVLRRLLRAVRPFAGVMLVLVLASTVPAATRHHRLDGSPVAGRLMAAKSVDSRAETRGPFRFAAIASQAQPSVVSEVQPFGGGGGRVVAVSVSPVTSLFAVAASESGGLFRTRDQGVTWTHIDSFEPNRLWDVQYETGPGGQVIIATVPTDSHVPSGVGIWRSTDEGATWHKPATASPPNCPNSPGRGIAFGPEPNVFVGTDCGLAISRDRGATWRHFSTGFSRVWNILVQPGPGFPGNANSVIVDICGDRGPQRSTDNGGTFSPPPTGIRDVNFPATFCSLAASPFEPNVLFAATPNTLWESDNGGATWTVLLTRPNPGRRPFVVTRRSFHNHPSHFDLYFHPGADLFRQHCTKTSGPGLRCPVVGETACGPAVDDDGDGHVNEGCPAVGPSEGAIQAGCMNAMDDDGDGAVNDGCDLIQFASSGAHHDHGELAFRTTGASNCPIMLTNDGGISRTNNCGISWFASNTGLGALQIFDIAGTVHAAHTDLYIGTMDNQIFRSADGGLSWPAYISSEGFNLQAPQSATAHGQIVTGTSCFPCVNFQADDHFATDVSTPWRNPPGQTGQGTPYLLGAGRYAQLGDNAQTLFVRDAAGNWTQTSLNLPARSPSGQLFSAGPAANPTVYVVRAKGGPGNLNGLLRLTGLYSPTLSIAAADIGLGNLATWVQGAGEGQVGGPGFVVGVDPSNPLHLIAADGSTSEMKVSTNGGGTWSADAALTTLVTDGGNLRFTSPNLGAQAHAIAFDPANSKRILVGTEASGVIASLDDGASWFRVPGSRQIAAVSDFFFDGLRKVVYISTYGRGLWKANLESITPADLALTKSHSADPITEGNHLTYTLRLTNNGPAAAHQVRLTDTLPADVTFVSASPSSCRQTAGDVVCTLGTLAAGANVTVTIVVTPLATGGITATRNVAVATGSTYDSNAANNSAETTVYVVPPTLAVVQTASPDPVTVGDELTFTITVTNRGLAAVQNVTLADTLPGGASLIFAGPGCTGVGTPIVCSLGNLARLASATVTLVVAPTHAPSATNTVSLTQSPHGLSAGSSSFSATVSGLSCTLSGTPQDDVLTGTAGSDVICGLAGGDTISGLDGSDFLYGGAGEDALDGGDGRDQLDGGGSDDTLTGALSLDSEFGGGGNDTFDQGSAPEGFDDLAGGDGRDRVSYSARRAQLHVTLDDRANDGDTTIASLRDPLSEGDNVASDVEVVIGGAGRDLLVGNAFDNELFGEGEADTLDSGDGSDLVAGGPGDDRLDDGPGDDRDEGGTGDDRIVEWPGADVQSGGPGIDTADYFGRQSPLRVSLNGNADDGDAGAEGDNVLPDVENVIGGFADDVIVGSGAANRLLGGFGRDELRGLARADTLRGGAQDDREFGGPDNDRFNQDEAPEGADTLAGGGGTDTVDYGLRSGGVNVTLDGRPDDGDNRLGERDNVLADVENATGGDGADTLIGSAARNLLRGGANRDRLFGGDQSDRLNGGAGRDVESGGDGDDVFFQEAAANDRDRLLGGAGADTADYGARSAGVDLSLDGVANDGATGELDNLLGEIENLVGGAGPDILTGDDFANLIRGGPDRDKLFGLGADDALDGGPAADDVDGGAGADTCAPDPLDAFVSCP